MAVTNKSEAEILKSESMEDVLDWIKAHKHDPSKAVDRHLIELAKKRYGPYDPDIYFDPIPKKKP